MGKNGKDVRSMIVLYQKGLEEVAAQLLAMGYHVHPLESCVEADAVLYLSDVQGALRARAGASGAAMICVRGLDIPQIAAAIGRRGCAPLF